VNMTAEIANQVAEARIPKPNAPPSGRSSARKTVGA
jgi:hypothetical protein